MIDQKIATAIKVIVGLICSGFCHLANAEPTNANVMFVWQKPDESFQRKLNIQIIKDKNTYFLPLAAWSDVMSQMHQAVVLDAVGNWKCAEKQAPWGPFSHGEWCAKLLTKETAGAQSIEYRRKFDNYQDNRSQPLGRTYDVYVRFDIRWTDGRCSVDLKAGQEIYGGAQEHKTVTVANIVQQLCNTHTSH
jgi:hypothetical protein